MNDGACSFVVQAHCNIIYINKYYFLARFVSIYQQQQNAYKNAA